MNQSLITKFGENTLIHSSTISPPTQLIIPLIIATLHIRPHVLQNENIVLQDIGFIDIFVDRFQSQSTMSTANTFGNMSAPAYKHVQDGFRSLYVILHQNQNNLKLALLLSYCQTLNRKLSILGIIFHLYWSSIQPNRINVFTFIHPVSYQEK